MKEKWSALAGDFRTADAFKSQIIDSSQEGQYRFLQKMDLRSHVGPNNAQASMSLAITWRYTGDLQAKLGDRTGALANYEQVLQILQRLAKAEPRNVLLQGRYSEMLPIARTQLFMAKNHLNRDHQPAKKIRTRSDEM